MRRFFRTYVRFSKIDFFFKTIHLFQCLFAPVFAFEKKKINLDFVWFVVSHNAKTVQVSSALKISHTHAMIYFPCRGKCDRLRFICYLSGASFTKGQDSCELTTKRSLWCGCVLCGDDCSIDRSIESSATGKARNNNESINFLRSNASVRATSINN